MNAGRDPTLPKRFLRTASRTGLLRDRHPSHGSAVLETTLRGAAVGTSSVLDKRKAILYTPLLMVSDSIIE